MDYMDWQIIQTLAKEKNITVTAEKLFITQPALTYRIKRIEEELKVKILVRTSKGVFFTSSGLIVSEYADEMLKQYSSLQNTISSMNDVVRGNVDIAVSPAFVRHKMIPILAKFREEYPEVNVHINAMLSTRAIEMLLADSVHIAIYRGNYNVNLETCLLCEEPITLIYNNEFDLEKLTSLPYIMYITDINLEREIINWWRENFSTPPKTIMHINDSQTCREMVANGLGFSILPGIEHEDETTAHSYRHINLKNKNGELLIRPTWLAFKKPIKKIKAAKAFIDFFKKHVDKKGEYR